jgi:hypothetical protein
MEYDIDLFEDINEPFEVFQPMPSALSDPQLPRELRRSSLTFFVVDKPGDDPELVSAQELGTKPLTEPLLMPLTDKTNVSSPNPSTNTSLLNKPPSSPRPSFRSLPPTIGAEQTRSLFPELSQFNAESSMGAQRKDSNTALNGSVMSSHHPNSAKELFATASTQSLNAPSSSVEQFQSSDTNKRKSSSNNSQAIASISQVQNTKKPSSSLPVKAPPITTIKSAIPPTFTPNASPSFNSPASTKPKHKSPLGSQPPIFAPESSTKPPSRRQPAADLTKAAHNLATIAFLEPHGILQQYVEHAATALVEDALRQFEREEPLRAGRESRITYPCLFPY